MSRPYALLDRDGTLVEDPGYLYRVEDYRPLPGVIEGLQRLSAAGLGLCILTNQSGIGRGFFREQDFQSFQSHLVSDLAAHGIRIEATYHCPHAPEAGCGCRKPRTGLIERAQLELGLDLEHSWLIGDKPEDIELARRSGCQGIYVLTGEGAGRRSEIASGTPVVADLLAAAAYIESRLGAPTLR